jgi:hypothetical protein
MIIITGKRRKTMRMRTSSLVPSPSQCQNVTKRLEEVDGPDKSDM